MTVQIKKAQIISTHLLYINMEYFSSKYHLKDQPTFEELMPCDKAQIWSILAFTALLENQTVKSYERNKKISNEIKH